MKIPYAKTGLLSLCLLLAQTGCTSPAMENRSQTMPADGLFSWHAETAGSTGNGLFPLMRQSGLSALYQNFSAETGIRNLAAFFQTASDNGVALYDLKGDPSWGLDPEGAKMCQAIREAAALNRRIQRQLDQDRMYGLTGIVLDVEPYLLDEWKEHPAEVMDAFVSGLRHASQTARQCGLELVVCIPWHYDTAGLEPQLETLVREGCDCLAVMNYLRGHETETIAAEAVLAEKHNRPMIVIYELQEADGRQVLPENTYHEAGLEGARQNFAALAAAYDKQSVSFAVHDYEALKEVLSDE